MLAEFAVVEPDDQPQPRVEPAGAQGGVDIELIVVIDQRQCARLDDARLDQRRVVRLRRLQDPHGFLRRFRAVSGLLGRQRRRTRHRRRHPAQQRAGPFEGAGRRRNTGAVPLAGGGDDERHPFAVDVPEFGGEPMRQGVIAADHHVRGAVALLGLERQVGHTS